MPFDYFKRKVDNPEVHMRLLPNSQSDATHGEASHQQEVKAAPQEPLSPTAKALLIFRKSTPASVTLRQESGLISLRETFRVQNYEPLKQSALAPLIQSKRETATFGGPTGGAHTTITEILPLQNLSAAQFKQAFDLHLLDKPFREWAKNKKQPDNARSAMKFFPNHLKPADKVVHTNKLAKAFTKTTVAEIAQSTTPQARR